MRGRPELHFPPVDLEALDLLVVHRCPLTGCTTDRAGRLPATGRNCWCGKENHRFRPSGTQGVERGRVDGAI